MERKTIELFSYYIKLFTKQCVGRHFTLDTEASLFSFLGEKQSRPLIEGTTWDPLRGTQVTPWSDHTEGVMAGTEGQLCTRRASDRGECDQRRRTGQNIGGLMTIFFFFLKRERDKIKKKVERDKKKNKPKYRLPFDMLQLIKYRKDIICLNWSSFSFSQKHQKDISHPPASVYNPNVWRRVGGKEHSFFLKTKQNWATRSQKGGQGEGEDE